MAKRESAEGSTTGDSANDNFSVADEAEEENIRKTVEIALSVVSRRRSNLRNSAPDYIQIDWKSLGIDQIVSAMEIQNFPPFTIKKYFISDMAIMASRVWECFSVDPEGTSHAEYAFECPL